MKSAHMAVAVVFIAGCMMNGCTQDRLPTEAFLPPQAPVPTGSGVFTTYIDGSPWAAEDNAGSPAGTSTYSGNILHISGARPVVGDTAESGESVNLIIDLSASKASLSPSTYELGTIPAQEGEARHFDGMSCVCRTDGAHSGTVTITALDVSRKVVAGTFAFNGVGVNGQTHTFSEGMFDVTWK
jgi:hypothetical protein